MSQKRATIIFNPMSGRPGRRADNVQLMIRLLSERGVIAQAHPTTAPDDATRLAREAVASGSEIIVGYGGDGTLNEVIQGMARSRAALAVWPGGTSNVVARDLGVPFKVNELVPLIAAGKTQRISLGLARNGSEFTGLSQRGQDSGSELFEKQETLPADDQLTDKQRYFVMMAGIGLDASIARSVNKALKRRTGEFAYWLSGIRHLFLWRAEPFCIEVDGSSYNGAFALIGNGKGYGGGMMMTPGAKLEEPWFEVYILPPLASNFAYLRALGACMRGKPEVKGVSIIRGKQIRASSEMEPWVEADGELLGPLPMTFEIVPEALSVIVP